jgi:hypothetical protein
MVWPAADRVILQQSENFFAPETATYFFGLSLAYDNHGGRFAALYMLGFNFSGGDLSSGVRGAGSGQHLASVLQEGRENANIDAGLGFIWRISG